LRKLWDKFDTDKSGALDLIETKNLFKEILDGIGQKFEFTDEAFM